VLRDAEATAGPRSVSAAVAASFVAEAQYELDRPEEARATLAGRWHMLYYSPPDPLVRGMLTLARTAACLAGPTAAANFLADALPRFQIRGSDRALALLLHERIRVELLAGRVEHARAEVQALRELAERNVGAEGFLAEVGYIYSLAQARLLLTENAPAAALRHLESARAEGARLHRARIEAKASLLAARCYEILHRPAEALAAAQHAIDLSEPGGMRRTILDQGIAVIAFIVSHASRLRISPDLLSTLARAASPGSQTQASRTSGMAQPTATGERLTPRELAIADLLAQSMSNKRIAAALGISPATVKWNLQNIFLKLGVNTRYDVITWLRQERPA
jgi:LuxR family maltose regulon positive regulatory protein